MCELRATFSEEQSLVGEHAENRNRMCMCDLRDHGSSGWMEESVVTRSIAYSSIPVAAVAAIVSMIDWDIVGPVLFVAATSLLSAFAVWSIARLAFRPKSDSASVLPAVVSSIAHLEEIVSAQKDGLETERKHYWRLSDLVRAPETIGRTGADR